MPQIVDRPAHVPPELVRDFDFNAIPGMEKDVHAAWKRVQDENPDIFWSPHYGGTWVVTRADDVARLQTEYEVFSMVAQGIPRNPTINLPIDLDPPQHGPVRAILNPLFAPGVIRRLEEVARKNAINLIDGFKANGRCEFITDFGRQLPIKVFLSMVDVPEAHSDQLLEFAETRVRCPDPEKREAAKQGLLAYLGDIIQERLAAPKDDVLSKIVTAKLDGQQISIDTAKNLLSVVMFGGLDTIATMMAFVVRYLAMDADLRHYLRDNPAEIPKAVEEFIRRHGLTAGGRLILKDVVFKGVQLKQGDIIMATAIASGLDERRFPNPMAVDINRPNTAQTLTFGSGPHRCPGANLGRAELRIFLEEWLSRIPDFSLDPEDLPVMAAGIVSGIVRLPLLWTP